MKVNTASEWTLNVKTTITLDSGVTEDDVEDEILEEIKQYYKEVIKNEWESGKWTIRVSQVENRILDIDGIIDVSATKLLTSSESEYEGNCNMYSNNIPVINKIEVTVNDD